ncbi:serine protease ami-like [Hermetia illucens]|uniref:serine protease ami-like n=1 Tax=Hermetia illucens TaxID=343691 RepID=UPI0018CC341A|nr:serine protease ami-like [Hermetia illucens]
MKSVLKLFVLIVITGYSYMQNKIFYNELLGRVANPQEFPGLVSVQYAQLNKGHICCGIIVSNHYVVSAASCYGYLPDDVIKDWLYIIIGGDSITPDGNMEQQMLHVKQIIVYPTYNYTPRHDIALLYIRKGIRYDGEFIKNMAIANEEVVVNTGSKCRTAGWAVSKRKHMDVYSKLMAFNLSIVDKSVCRCSDDSNDCYQQGLCVASMEDEMACFTFRGNPLVCNGIVVGIRSANRAECVSDSNGTIFLATWPYLSWINGLVTSRYRSMKKRSASIPTNKATCFTLLIAMAVPKSFVTF